MSDPSVSPGIPTQPPAVLSLLSLHSLLQHQLNTVAAMNPKAARESRRLVKSLRAAEADLNEKLQALARAYDANTRLIREAHGLLGALAPADEHSPLRREWWRLTWLLDQFDDWNRMPHGGGSEPPGEPSVPWRGRRSSSAPLPPPPPPSAPVA